MHAPDYVVFFRLLPQIWDQFFPLPATIKTMQDTAAGAVKAQFPALVGGMLKNIWNQPQGVFSVKGGRDSVDVFSIELDGLSFCLQNKSSDEID